LRIPRWSLAPLIVVGCIGAWLALKPRSTDPQTAIVAHDQELLRDTDSPVGGNPQGDVTLVEFFDYSCPYCRQMVPLLAEAETADPQLRVVYKEFPVLGPSSVFAAKAALAADRQGKFIAFHRALYQVRGPIDPNRTLQAAAATGLDVDRLKSDMQDPAIEAVLNRNLALARMVRIDDTPGFVIGRQILLGLTPLSTLQAAIRGARGSAQTAR
jgi:protein-disulfide isomerase